MCLSKATLQLKQKKRNTNLIRSGEASLSIHKRSYNGLLCLLSLFRSVILPSSTSARFLARATRISYSDFHADNQCWHSTVTDSLHIAISQASTKLSLTVLNIVRVSSCARAVFRWGLYSPPCFLILLWLLFRSVVLGFAYPLCELLP